MKTFSQLQVRECDGFAQGFNGNYNRCFSGSSCCGLGATAFAVEHLFNAEAHKSALLVLLDTPPNSTGDINRLAITIAKTDPTWVQYHIGIPIPASDGGGENGAFGFAHFVHGKWKNVWGPAPRFTGSNAPDHLRPCLRSLRWASGLSAKQLTVRRQPFLQRPHQPRNQAFTRLPTGLAGVWTPERSGCWVSEFGAKGICAVRLGKRLRRWSESVS